MPPIPELEQQREHSAQQKCLKLTSPDEGGDKSADKRATPEPKLQHAPYELESQPSHDGAAPAAAAVGAVTTPGLPAAGTQASSAAAASALPLCPQQATIFVQDLANKCRQRFLDGFAVEDRRVVERILERQADYEYEIVGLSQSSKALAPYDW